MLFDSPILNESDISEILNISTLKSAYADFENSEYNMKYLNVEIPDNIKQKILTSMALDLYSHNTIPLRLIKGDVHSHVDKGNDSFQKTYLIYLTNCEGSFVIEDNEYPIIAGHGFVFNEGLEHQTINTSMNPRILIGPMNESGKAVGLPGFVYYANETDANNVTNGIPNYISTTVLPFDDPSLSALGLSGIYTYWQVGTSGGDVGAIFYPGDPISFFAVENVFPVNILCYGENTKILCLVKGRETYIKVSEMNNESIVKAYSADFGSMYKKVDKIGYGYTNNNCNNWQFNMYKLENYKGLIEPLMVTGGHSILVDKFVKGCLTKDGKPVIIEEKYLLLAGLSDLFTKMDNSKVYKYYHFTLESENGSDRHAVYANGILSETPSRDYFDNHFMKLVD